jgi:micrococcal nuclease
MVQYASRVLQPLAFSLLLAFAFAGSSPAWEGRAIHIADGDTITVLFDGRNHVKVRLYGIDAPEKGQAFGDKAKAFTSGMVGNRVVEVTELARDRYGRVVALVEVGGRSVNLELLRAGLAWVYPAYCNAPYCNDWRGIEAESRGEGRGLWSHPAPVPPWDFRRTGDGTRRHAGEAPGAFRGNVQSRVFHAPACRHFLCVDCTRSFTTRAAALASGYSPCGLCRP